MCFYSTVMTKQTSFARVAVLRNITMISKNMKGIWRASFLKSREQAYQCKNSGETEEVVFIESPETEIICFLSL